MSRRRIAVLASGGGSNLQALLDHQHTLGGSRAADVVLVASDRAEAGALERARKAGVSAAQIPADRPRALTRLLDAHEVDLVALAGYLKLVPAEVTRRFAGAMVNVHPSLLPDFGGPGMYGARVHRAVIAAGVRSSGATVHFVDDVYDRGAVLVRLPVPVLAGDDERTLAQRVLRAEHLLFPRVIQALAAGRAPTTALTLPMLDPALNDAENARLVDRALLRRPHSQAVPDDA